MCCCEIYIWRSWFWRILRVNTANLTISNATRYELNIKSSSVEETDVKIQSECLNGIVFRQEKVQEHAWLPVDQGMNAYVFSAFYDAETNSVLLIGLKLSGVILRYTCQLWYANGTGRGHVNSHVFRESKMVVDNAYGESHERRYTSVRFKCFSPLGKKPSYVSAVETPCREPSNHIAVKSMEIPKTYKRRFTVCLMPLHNNFNDSYALVQWIELNLLLGAENFVVYNYSSSANIRTILDLYTKRNITEVVQWSIPVEEVHYFGQVAAINDCLYRSKHDSEFLVNVDLDEYIIPRYNAKTWSDVIANSSEIAFVFRNVFYRKDVSSRENDFPNKPMAEEYKLSTLLTSVHDAKILPHNQRSKYIVRTSKVNVLMIHEVPFFGNGARALFVSPHVASVHHYRDDKADHDKFIHDDTVLQKYGQQLIENVKDTWEHLS
ncbi:hypothetical protein DPMN_173822 [Dreissena polymorpha]|uniref:Glycosyltransferase family 92 protein n=2 Tax=Dreissena polymorpha TaxID=45954 RepID=A0A9D4E2B2_DREPO|nr:hypothetical protein DPMN_173822 [Dreissena polymorpha]